MSFSPPSSSLPACAPNSPSNCLSVISSSLRTSMLLAMNFFAAPMVRYPADNLPTVFMLSAICCWRLGIFFSSASCFLTASVSVRPRSFPSLEVFLYSLWRSLRVCFSFWRSWLISFSVCFSCWRSRFRSLIACCSALTPSLALSISSFSFLVLSAHSPLLSLAFSYACWVCSTSLRFSSSSSLCSSSCLSRLSMAFF